MLVGAMMWVNDVDLLASVGDVVMGWLPCDELGTKRVSPCDQRLKFYVIGSSKGICPFGDSKRLYPFEMIG